MSNAPMEQAIRQKLEAAFTPIEFQIVNESHMHSVPPNSETHFKVVLVSDAFVGKRQVQRHQAVYRVLAEELAGGVHALALHTYSPADWVADTAVPASPECLGGSKADSH